MERAASSGATRPQALPIRPECAVSSRVDRWRWGKLYCEQGTFLITCTSQGRSGTEGTVKVRRLLDCAGSSVEDSYRIQWARTILVTRRLGSVFGSRT